MTKAAWSVTVERSKIFGVVMGHMLVRRFSCQTCGAPSETTEEAIVVLCRHCGSFVGFDEDAIYKGDRFARAGRKMICGVGTIEAARAFERSNALRLEMDEVTKTGDREKWRLLAWEYYSLFAVAYPDYCPSVNVELRNWMISTIAFAELSTFVPAIAKLQSKYNELAAQLSDTNNALSLSKEMLVAAKAYYSACLSHPEMEAGVATEGVNHHAKEMVRASISPLSLILGEGVVSRILHEVLGDRQVDEKVKCPGCGALVEESICPFCGSALSAKKDDFWLTQTLAIFQAVLPELNARGVLDEVEPIMSVMSYVFIPRQSGNDLSPHLAAEFIRLAVPWVSWEQLWGGIEIYRTMYEKGSADDQFIEKIIDELQPWQSIPEQRPAPPKPHLTPQGPVGKDDPWVAHASSLWSMGMAQSDEISADTLVSFCLPPFFQNQPISIYQAVAFFDSIAPSMAKEELRRAAETLRSGFDEGLPVTLFLEDLAKYYEQRC